MLWIYVAMSLLGAFLLGSIPFSLLLGKLIGRVDIRKHGSGNVGATNFARVCGWRYFPQAFLLDFAKGLLPPLCLAPLIPFDGQGGTESIGPLLFRTTLALTPVLGHTFSPFLRFRGGKGVATGAGAMAALLPLETGVALGIWLLILALSRTVGIASSCAAVALPVAFLVRHPDTSAETLLIGGLCVLLAILVVYRHRSNIRQFFARKGPGSKVTEVG